MVEERRRRVLPVHVATPLEECERRDRKGLYAKARRGEIPEFTGISSPYEEPDDAAVRVDTTGRTIEDALDDVIEALAESGHLDLRESTSARLSVRAERALETRTTAPSTSSSSAPPTSAARPTRAGRPRAGRRRTASTFASAGTHGFDAHPMDAGDVEHARRRPTTASGASRLTRELVEWADLILTAESSTGPSCSRSTRRRCARSSRSGSSPGPRRRPPTCGAAS